MEFLKEFFGNEPLTYDQLAAKAAEKKMKLADISGGAYVGKEKYNALLAERDDYKNRLDEANGQIEKFKGMDIEGIQAAADEWKKKAEKAEQEAAEKIASIQFDNMLDSAIGAAKGKNAKAIKALLDVDSLKSSKNQSEDLNKALESLKTDNDYLFDDAKPAPIFSGPTPGATSTGMDAIRAAAGLKTETK